jgi:hypothetical chaperone protein
VKIGIDFGTTNSAVAVVGPDGEPRIVELAPGERVQRTVIHASLEGRVSFGNAAFRAYQEDDLTGRFLRSIKTFLPDDVPDTTLAGRRHSFPSLVTAYLTFLLTGAERVLGAPVTELVVGRPVRFHAEPERHALAVKRLEDAVAAAFPGPWSLVPEPVAAAHRYERGLDRERLVLVGDFGGGTADFAVFRAGPGRTGDRVDDVLATSGVAKAGDALDAVFLATFLAPAFGRGARWRNPRSGEVEEWRHPLTVQIERLYALPLLRSRALEEGLQRVEPLMVDPAPVRRLRRLVFDDLGYPLAWAIEATKRAFSETPTPRFAFDEFHSPALDLSLDVGLSTYAEGAADLLAAYARAVDEVLHRAGLRDGDVDDVFLTGGTSQLPFVRDLFAARFGAHRIAGADAFTSVCEGLALAAPGAPGATPRR